MIRKTHFLVIIVFFLVFTTAVYSASCAQKSYTTSCLKCTFDKDGKMDQACYQKYQDSGVACLFSAYPIESIQYKMGNCPAIDVCVDRLNTCKALYTQGNDKFDCDSDSINHCFVRGDACVARAVKDCSGTPPGDLANDLPPASFCDGFFFFIALFAGLLFVKNRRV